MTQCKIKGQEQVETVFARTRLWLTYRLLLRVKLSSSGAGSGFASIAFVRGASSRRMFST
jgi:hypothetical protein